MPKQSNRGQLTDAIVAFHAGARPWRGRDLLFLRPWNAGRQSGYLVPRDGMPGSISTLVDATELLKPIDDILKNPPPNNGTVIMYSTEAGGVSFELLKSAVPRSLRFYSV